MKILAINGSGRGRGNTRRLLEAIGDGFPKEVNYEVVDLSEYAYDGCIGCEGCASSNKCVIKDDMQKLYPLIDEADGLILGSPTYYYNISSKMKAFIERMYAYQIFDVVDRRVWTSVNEVKGIRYAATVAVCEQDNEKDMGLTSLAMSMPLEALGYRVVSNEKLMNLFKRNDLVNKSEMLKQMTSLGKKMYKTIKLVK